MKEENKQKSSSPQFDRIYCNKFMICFISKNKEGRRKDHFCMCSLKYSRLKISPVPKPFSFSSFALEIAFPICRDQSSLEKRLNLGLDRKNIR